MLAFPVDIIPVVILSIAPGIFWLWYFYKRNTLEPEPKALVAQVFFFGMICLAPAALIEQLFRPYPFVQTVIVAPIVEELIKFLLVYLWIARRTDFNEPMDGIVYASAAALGFASSENALYIASAYLFPQIALDIHDPAYGLQWVWKIYLVRAFLTVPGHAVWSAMWGYAIGWARFVDPARTRPLIVKGVLISIVLHAFFNFLVNDYPIGAAGMLFLVPLMWKMLDDRIRRAIEQSPFRKNVDE